MRKSLLCLLLCAISISGSAWAQQSPQCAGNYKQGGNYLLGRQFSTWGIVPVSPDVAFRRIARAGVAAGLTLVSSDKDAGVLSFRQNNAGTQTFVGNGQQVSIPWNVVIEPDGSGSKISVNKSTPPSYSVSKDFEIKSMCSVIDSAAKDQ
jgi:hypothetical protein